MNIVKGFTNLLLKSGPRDLNRLEEPKMERESQKRIMSPCAAVASIKIARMVSAFTLVNKVPENQSLMKCRSGHVKKTKCANFGESNHSISSIQHREKNCYLFFYYKVSVWRLSINAEGESKHLLQGSRCGQK